MTMDFTSAYNLDNLKGVWAYIGIDECEGLKVEVADESGKLTGKIVSLPQIAYGIGIGDVWWKDFKKKSGDTFYCEEKFIVISPYANVEELETHEVYYTHTLQFLSRTQIERIFIENLDVLDPVAYYVKMDEKAEEEFEEKEKASDTLVREIEQKILTPEFV